MARAFEHEFFGHGVEGFKGDPAGEKKAVNYVNKIFREPADIPNRRNYTDNFSNFGKLYYKPKKRKLEKIKKIIDTSSYQ